ncbi:hypothetical protein PMZ80_004223 [Knufia obscura]|uniref:Endonuclease/exonuclease/phosphatase domain-containing protein n=2 Tax=Knufia TaxID=430999 RepID=A0AAN8II15_9EURO|nr:hypothetical protein PMZ80_004223 [Knufia obscura]KAK5948652.1 hypothetical protein OHC33_010254 [Knufia fluminis]
MKLSFTTLCYGASALLATNIYAETIAEINGNKFLSPYRNKDVSNVTGLITAKGPDGFWIRSTKPDQNRKTSESLYVYDNGTVSGNLTSGDVITLGGRLSEYRSSSTYLYLTELTRPSNVHVVSQGNEVNPVVIGQDIDGPPTEQYSSLDNGDVFGVPNNSSQISAVNPELQPSRFGLDYWESIMGELVTVRKPVAINKPNQYGDTWITGDWNKTGQNARGGLTLTAQSGNPETIVIGEPLDGTSNPDDTKLGDSLKDITGVVYQAFGTYRILPLTALSVISSQEPALPEPVTYAADGTCKSLTVADYNIENFSPNSTGVEGRAEHIVTYLNSPDLIFLQEIQDDDGPTNDGVVSANRSLEVLIDAISQVGAVQYAYVDIDPVNNEDGGQPGGNIRNAYLYNPEVLELAKPNPGAPLDATKVLAGPSLSFNPGRIEPNSSAWEASRKPLAAQWRIISDNTTFFTVNVHFTSKGGSSPIEGDPRPPVNLGIDQRTEQANITAAFIADILAEDPNAAVIMAGDCNEFAFVEPLKVFVAESGLIDLDEAAGVDPVERYTYLFDMNSQELDHIFVSKKIADQEPKLEHMHVNTWVSYDDQISDHDPSVAQLNVC